MSVLLASANTNQVLLLSLHGLRLRILEAYFDGHEVVVRRIAAFDFSFMNYVGFKTFAQWFHGQPKGDISLDNLVRARLGDLSVSDT